MTYIYNIHVEPTSSLNSEQKESAKSNGPICRRPCSLCCVLVRPHDIHVISLASREGNRTVLGSMGWLWVHDPCSTQIPSFWLILSLGLFKPRLASTYRGLGKWATLRRNPLVDMRLAGSCLLLKALEGCKAQAGCCHAILSRLAFMHSFPCNALGFVK
ncbi:hypothetical protein BDV09DRAFT_133555 [Aspergillus tetrazonus]